MAQLDTGGGEEKKGGKVRAKKLSSSVDLTAMVDLAFLLITFFMLTTTLNKPQSMDLSLPDKNKDPEKKEIDQKVDENRTLTILMGKDNSLKYYKGLLENPLVPPTDVTYGKNGIRQVLVEEKQKAIQYTGDPDKNLIVIIKPAKESNYKNLVDILDEMAIVKVPTYAISDINDVEVKILDGFNITQ